MKAVIAIALMAAIVLSALGVVSVHYQRRSLFAEAYALDEQIAALHTERERLLLEQSTWARHNRIDTIARTQLNMVPSSSQPERVMR